MNCKDFPKIHFVGLLGVGMSALAQFLAMQKVSVQGSDRSAQKSGKKTAETLNELNIACYPQDGSAIASCDWVVISSAIEESNPDLKQAHKLGKIILHRSELLKKISERYKTIAISGTSGKSTTTSMIFEILKTLGLDPGIITGAGLNSLKSQKHIGNAWCGSGEYLIIEADESDGSLIQYKPHIGVALNLEKDHKELSELKGLFEIFKKQSKHFIVNTECPNLNYLQTNPKDNFGFVEDYAISISNIKQIDWGSTFTVNKTLNTFLPTPGIHNVENAAAALAVAQKIGLKLSDAVNALQNYQGISRRHQLLTTHQSIRLIDDFAHNPAKIAASIKSSQKDTGRVFAFWQPHGFGPTKFLRKELVQEIANSLREQDHIWMPEIYYAGGTATKDISAFDLIKDLKKLNIRAHFVKERNRCFKAMLKRVKPEDTLLLMGARDPSLEEFASSCKEMLKSLCTVG